MTERFGLWAHCPKDAKVAWGARAILKNGVVDLLWDRQSWRGSDEPEQPAFVELLKPAIEEVRREVSRLCGKYKLRHDEQKLHVLYEGPGVKILGDTRGSYGYLYLIAFPQQAERQTVPVPLSELPKKRCGVDYSPGDCLPVPKTAKFKVASQWSVRYFARRLAAAKHVARLNREAYSFSDRAYLEEV